MNKENNTVQRQFCIWCGNEIKSDSKFCPKCGKKQIEEENQFIDWLIAHTKDKLKGDAESSLFNAIKNFILSHMYGTVMSIAIVAAIGVTVYAGEPYIEKYRDADAPQYIKEALYGAQNDSNTDYNHQMNKDVHDLCNEYMMLIHNIGEEYRGGGVITVDHLLVPENIYSKGKYDDVSSEIMADSHKYDGIQVSGSFDKTVFDKDQFRMTVSKELAANGFTVGECLANEQLENLSSGKAVYSQDVRFSCVLVNDKWYIAAVEKADSYIDESYFYEIDENQIKLLIEKYVEAIYSGDDLSDIVFQLPEEIDYTPVNGINTLTEKYPVNYGYTVYISLPTYSSMYPPTEQLEKMGYTVLGASVRIIINRSADNERAKFETSHNFTFVDINGQYKVVDDRIISQTLSS